MIAVAVNAVVAVAVTVAVSHIGDAVVVRAGFARNGGLARNDFDVGLFDQVVEAALDLQVDFELAQARAGAVLANAECVY